MAREAPFPPPRDLASYPEEPPPFAPKPRREIANLEELAQKLEPWPPLKSVAEAIANLKFHDLMEMANAIGPPRTTTSGEAPNYELAASLNAWALAQLK
jgi:hypothetical protein